MSRVRAILSAACALAALAAQARAGSAPERLSPDFASLARQPMIVLPRPPDWIAGPGSASDVAKMTAEVGRATDKVPQFNYVHSAFVRPDKAWLKAYVAWFRKLDKPLNLHFEDELFDCDKFSRCFVAFAELIAPASGDGNASMAIGWATVYNEVSYGGIPAGTAHAIVIVWTNEGPYVVEPQSGDMVELSGYPNRNSIKDIYF